MTVLNEVAAMSHGCLPTAPGRRALLLAGMAMAAWPPLVAAARVVLERPASLRAALAASLAMQRPLVVMVSLEGCGFCIQARDSYLGPLRDQQGQPVVQVDMRGRAAIEDFDGRRTTHDALTREWRITVAPTVLFFGTGGREVAERLVGGYLPDFYGAYLDERLQVARKSLRG